MGVLIDGWIDGWVEIGFFKRLRKEREGGAGVTESGRI